MCSSRSWIETAADLGKKPTDRNRAIEVIEEVIDEHGPSPESLGILGRCHKERWLEKVANGDLGATDALDQAIDAYRRGFEADPRDFYPGVNVVTLLVRRGRPEDLELARQLAPVVSFAAARRGGAFTSALTGEEAVGRRALSAMLDTDPDPWMKETTADNLDILIDALPAVGQSSRWVGDVVQKLRQS